MSNILSNNDQLITNVIEIFKYIIKHKIYEFYQQIRDIILILLKNQKDHKYQQLLVYH